MTIEITNPELERLIERRLRTGVFRSSEDVLLDALRTIDSQEPSGAVIVAAMQASPHKEVELIAESFNATVREVEL
jgi:Arc/MetJ-type ribon-helix-helix transcriptional regulator